MAAKLSTGLRNALLAVGSLKSVLDGGFIKVYSGTPPLSADDAIGSQGSNTLLVTISLNGGVTGIDLDAAAAAGTIGKDPAQTWKGTIANSGTASFFRHVTDTDDGTASTTQERIQGGIANSNAEMNFSNLNLVAAAEQPIDHYFVTLPTL